MRIPCAGCFGVSVLLGIPSGLYASFVSLKPIPNVVSNADQNGYISLYDENGKYLQRTIDTSLFLKQ